MKRRMTTISAVLAIWAFGAACGIAAPPDNFAALCADRTAVERVHYAHLLGDKPPFEQSTPPALIERLVKADQHKEAVLKRVYGVEINAAMLQAEVQRINATTRAPETLAELKAALGGDPARFAQTVAKPILVERLLHERFDNDDALHAAQRKEAEAARGRLLAAGKSEANPNPEVRRPIAEVSVNNLIAILRAGHSNEVAEATWQLGPRPPETNAPSADEIEIKKRFGPKAQIISSPRNAERDAKVYFEDLPPALQNVLRVQLRQAGDVSAVIEVPNSFLLYVAKAMSTEALEVAVLSIHKRGYDDWLNQQTEAP